MGKFDLDKSKTANTTTDDFVARPPMPAPGKRPLTRDPSGPVGDRYIDHGAVCDNTTGPDCFLTKEQRARLIADIQHRMSDAATAYLFAAEEVRVDELMTRDDDLPIVVGLVLDLAGAYAATKAILALTKLKGNFLTRVGGQEFRGEDVPEMTTRAADALAKITPAQMTLAVNAPFAQAKTQVSAQLKSAANQPKANQKDENLAYIDQLKAQARRAFTKVREEVPGIANDAELIAWREAFDPEQHMIATYKTALVEKLARLRASGAQSIARRDPANFAALYGDRREPDREANDDYREYHDSGIYVVWHAYASGYPRELVFRCYGRSDRENVFATGHAWGPRYGGQAPDTNPNSFTKGLTPWVPSETVPPEFHEYAVARHTQVWGSPPGVEMIDDSTWYWASERAKKAAENKAKDPFLVPAKSTDDLVKASQQRTGLPAKAPAPAPKISPRPVDIPDAFKLDLRPKKDQGDDL